MNIAVTKVYLYKIIVFKNISNKYTKELFLEYGN